MKVWRLLKSRYAESAASAFEGARVNGGRWSSPGTRIVYASESAALAALEAVMWLGDPDLLRSYSLVTTTIPDALVEDLDLRWLPPDWSGFPARLAVQAIGDAWVRSRRSLALRVPSVIVTESWNVLINPGHRAFRRLRVDTPLWVPRAPRVLF